MPDADTIIVYNLQQPGFLSVRIPRIPTPFALQME